ncbi:ankyrin repeat domain-containing protein [Wolbachia endosymbiont (group B) of Episyrphus balteatus]|uniref:ankyrin repeat domain-containing protein n=1 Tax=Wolbachia endosymbiont (group B) of Episyrphus balteatus TaxID=2954009 RepID=UPI002226B182|nr:ankyrin repeat domain-containing protein [Wolbachia endosymbiont (group B) of Episyrphus balteatus]
MLDCTDTSKLINNEKGHRRDFILLSLLTKLHLECLKQIQSGDRSKFPEDQENFLFDKIEAEVKNLKSQLVQLDAGHLKFIELALIDYKSVGDITLNKQHLVEFLISSYEAISKTISTKKMSQGTLDKKELRKVELLQKWKETIAKFDKDEKIKVFLDEAILSKVNKYLGIRRDAESLYKIYSTIDSCKKYFEKKGTTIEEKRLVLQTVLQKVGEYLKSTLDTPNLSDDTRKSLELEQLPIKLLTDFRDQIVHYQVFSLELDGRDITKLLDEGLVPIKEVVYNKIIGIEKGFIQDLVKENASGIGGKNVKELIYSYADEGITGLIKGIEQIKGRGNSEYNSMDDKSKQLVDEIYGSALQMKSRDFPLQSEGASKIKLDAKKLEIIEKCTEKSKLKVNKKVNEVLGSCNLDLHLSDVSKIEEVVNYLQYGIPSVVNKKKEADVVLNNFLSSTEVLDKITIFENGQRVPLKGQLEQYFDLQSFREKLSYSEFRGIKKVSLVNLLNSVNVDSGNKRALLKFLKSSNQNQGSPHDFITPDRYEELVKGLNLTPKSEEKLLSYSVEWRRNKCINLLESNPTALKVICDRITEGKVIPDQVFRNLAYQYKPKGENSADTEKRAISLQQSIESKVGNLYLREVKKKIDVLGRLSHPDAVQMQFVSIYSLLDRTRKNGDDPFLIRKLRNHLAHSEQRELFREQFLQLIEGAVKKIDISKEVTLSSFNKAVSDVQSQLKLSEIKEVVDETDTKSNSGFSKGNLNHCGSRGSARRARSITECLFSKEDVEKFSKGKVDENNVDKVIIDSERFLTYVKRSQDEAKNAQLIKFVGDKSIEGDYRYLVDRVAQEQGYERYIQNERIKDLYGGVSQMDAGSTKTSKLKGRLINAAGRIQLIRGIHGTVVSCADGDSIDCGLSVSGMAWSFASQPIENIIVKTAPKIVKSAGQFAGKMIPGALGRQAKFAITFTGVKIGSKMAKGVGGAAGGVFDLVDIGMSANNLVDCKNRENSDNLCTEKEIRDNIASISFSGVSFISGVALTAASMPGVGVAVGFALMLGQGIYSGVSNIIEYEEKYDTTHDENWSIFWRTLLLQPMAYDVQLLKARGDGVNIKAKAAWESLNDSPGEVVAYAVGLGQINYDTLSFDAGYGKILMNRTDADTENLSRALPKPIQDSEMICLPQFIERAYEKNIKKSIPIAIHYCENAMVIADKRRKSDGTTIIYNLESIDKGTIVGSSKLVNYFLIFAGSTTITGGDNTVNRFILFDRGFFGGIRGGYNATNIIDLSKLKSQDFVLEVKIECDTLSNSILLLKLFINFDVLIHDYIDKNADVLDYIYIGMENRQDNVVCTYDSQRTTTDDSSQILINSGGGLSKDKKDIVDSCKKVVVLPYTKVTGAENYYTFYIKTAGYRAKELYSEIDVGGTGTIVFPETSLLDDCDEIAYSSGSNTLSLKIGLVQGNQYTIEIKSYINTNSHQPNFILIDKSGSNVIPKIKKLESSFTKINSFDLHAEYPLDDFDAVEKHYNKILRNNKGYKVFGVLTGKLQSQSDSTLERAVFGSSGEDIINFDQKSMFARGGSGSDMYIVDSSMEKREITIDNNSDDKMLDILMLPEVLKEFLVQQCDLHLRANNTNVQVRNYLQDNSYRHFMVMNSKGETFIPYVESMSCVGSPIENGKLLPFLQATPTQNIFLLPKDLQDDHVVISSRLEEIERYKDKDDLLLVREGKIPFLIKIEDFYNDQGKWEDVNFLLWDNGNFSPYSGLYQEVNEVMDYQDKLKSDYEKSIKEYVIDFTQSVNITHNQDDALTPVGQDKERIGIMILKDITPDRIMVSSSDRNLVFSDKVSKHVINVTGWNDSESYRISELEFDLGLEPIIIRRLDGFSLSSIAQVQNLIDKASETCKKRDALEIDIKLPVAAQDGDFSKVKALLDRCASINAKNKDGFTPLHYGAANGNLGAVKYMVEKGADFNVQCDRLRTPLHLAAMYGHLEVVKYLKERGAAFNLKDHYEQSPLHSATINGKLEVVKYLVEEGANIDDKDKSGRTPLDFAVQKGHKDIVEFLKQKQSQSDLNSNLQGAINEGDLDIAESLVDRGADINVTNESGQTILHSAAGSDKIELVRRLLEKGANINSVNAVMETPLHYAVAEGGDLGTVKLLVDKGANINAANIYDRTPLHLATILNRLDLVKHFVEKGADFNLSDRYGDTPLSLATKKGYGDIIEYLEKKLNERKEISKQRKRRHHHGDHDRHHLSRKPRATDSINQPEIVASSGARSSSWINDLFGWVKNSIGGLLGSRTALSKETSSTLSSISQVNAPVDINSTIMLLDVLVRKVTGKKYISTVDQPISPLEAQGYALNITKGFEKVVEQAGLKSGVSMHRLSIDYMGMQKEITRKVMSGKFNEISGILSSYVEKACPDGEAGKLSPKKFDKFMIEFNKGLDITLNQSIEHNGDGRLEVNDVKEQQISLEPQSYLSNASIQGHLTRNKVKLIS